MIGTLRAAVRLLLFVVCTLGLYALLLVGRLLIPNKTYLRQIIFYYWTASFVRLSGMEIDVTGPRPRPPFFLVTNHVGYADIAAIRVVAEGVFVAKAEVSQWPLAGQIVRDMGTIFINRGNRRDIPRAGEKIVERLDAGEGVIIFPEGTSTKGETVLPFNSSFLEFAARRDLAVSYASLSYTTPSDQPPPSRSVCWWDDIGFFPHLWRLFKLPRYRATIRFGEAPVHDDDRKRLAAELHQRVSESFMPMT
jgi:1-acyl-sn-glycerol-3-phosphate acyltransferase